MKYFTPQLWLEFNSPRREKAFRIFDNRVRSYRKQLRPLLARLDPRARRFFRDALWLHDGKLATLELSDGITSVYACKWTGRGTTNTRRVRLRLVVLCYHDDFIYTLEYKDVARVALDFPGKIDLFRFGKYPNFGDWGYDELTAAKNGLLRHEILFSSGSSLAIEFENVSVRRKPQGSVNR